MKISKQSYLIDKDLPTVFQYFRSQDYLLSSLKVDRKKDIHISSSSNNELVDSADTITITQVFKGHKLQSTIYDIEVLPCRSISMKRSFGLSTPVGKAMDRSGEKGGPVFSTRIEFEEASSRVKVIETSRLENTGLLMKLGFRVFNEARLILKKGQRRRKILAGIEAMNE